MERKGYIWKDVKGYEGYYKINNYGEVKSLPRKLPHNWGKERTTTERIMSQYTSPQGYKRVGLTKNNVCKGFFVHRLVIDAFVGIKKGEHTNHKNCIKDDNRLFNLEVCSASENERHAYQNGMKGISPKWLARRRRVRRISDGKMFDSLCAVGREINSHPSDILKVCVGKRRTVKGEIYEYAR